MVRYEQIKGIGTLRLFLIVTHHPESCQGLAPHQITVRYSGTVSVGCDKLAPKPVATRTDLTASRGHTKSMDRSTENQGQPNRGVPGARRQ